MIDVAIMILNFNPMESFAMISFIMRRKNNAMAMAIPAICRSIISFSENNADIVSRKTNSGKSMRTVPTMATNDRNDRLIEYF